MSDLVSRLLEAIEKVEQHALGANAGIIRWDGTPEMRRVIADHLPNRVLRRCEADRRTVMDWIATTRDPYEGMSDDELHERCAHPAYEYARTEGQRKAWPYADDPPEENVGWDLNITSWNPDAFERFDYTEERYWRRLRPGGPRKREVSVPYYIRNLGIGYGITEEEK